MKTKYIILPLLTLAAVSTLSCNRVKKTAAEEEREKWLYSLNDSIAEYQARIKSATEELTTLQTEIGSMIVNFDHISNPRLVEGYYIYKGWDSGYPLKQTGIVARITEDEGFELIATLSGANFNQVSVSAGGETVSTDIVPHDQALNYRAGKLNTVCFYGERADSVGEFITDHMPEQITITFLNGNKTGSYTIPANQKEMIAATWQLFFSQRSSHHLEKEIPMLSKRIDVCRRMLDANDSPKND